MNLFDGLTKEEAKRLAAVWKSMGEEDKEHFVNQVALALSVLGDGREGREAVAQSLKLLLQDGSKNLSDVGLYMEKILPAVKDRKLAHRIKKAALLLESYRLRYDLPPVPHKVVA